MTAPESPARPSAFRLDRLTCGHQRRKGKNLYIQSGQAAASNRINYFEWRISFFWGKGKLIVILDRLRQHAAKA